MSLGIRKFDQFGERPDASIKLGDLDREKVRSSIPGRGLTTRALVRDVAQPARAKNKPMLPGANAAHRQKSIKSGTYVEAGGIENPDSGESGKKK